MSFFSDSTFYSHRNGMEGKDMHSRLIRCMYNSSKKYNPPRDKEVRNLPLALDRQEPGDYHSHQKPTYILTHSIG